MRVESTNTNSSAGSTAMVATLKSLELFGMTHAMAELPTQVDPAFLQRLGQHQHLKWFAGEVVRGHAVSTNLPCHEQSGASFCHPDSYPP
jgi:hypothetical protein